MNLKELRRGKPFERAHRKIVVPAVMNLQLFLEIIQGIEAMSRVKGLVIFAVRTFGLAVMARGIRTNAFVLDTTLFEQLLNQRRAIAAGRESIDKLGTVIGLNAFYVEIESLQHIFEERRREKRTQFIKAFNVAEA